MKKRFKAIVFILVFVLLLTAVSDVFTMQAKEGNNMNALKRDYIVADLVRQPENQVDVLVLGDSESYCSFSPAQLFHQTGITSYVAGQSSQRMNEAVSLLMEALETQKPKVVLLETNELFRSSQSSDYYTSVLGNFFQMVFPIFRYHILWKKNFLPVNVSAVRWKGFDARQAAVACSDLSDYMKADERKKKMPPQNLKALKQIKAICDEKGIQLVLYTCPSPENATMAKHNRVQAFADTHHIPYVDLNLHEELQMDWSQDTADGGDHTNIYGAMKVTEWLGSYFEKMGLSDHRNDTAYASWNDFTSAFFQSLGTAYLNKVDTGGVK
ncbi:MAG: hypothetical protein SOI52_03145 [Erysipelotrichaceae bacterium]|jgi:hypothetical protein